MGFTQFSFFWFFVISAVFRSKHFLANITYEMKYCQGEPVTWKYPAGFFKEVVLQTRRSECFMVSFSTTMKLRFCVMKRKQLIFSRREVFICIYNVTLNESIFTLFSLLSHAGKIINEKPEMYVHSHNQTPVRDMFVLLVPLFESSAAYRLNTRFYLPYNGNRANFRKVLGREA